MRGNRQPAGEDGADCTTEQDEESLCFGETRTFMRVGWSRVRQVFLLTFGDRITVRQTTDPYADDIQ